VVDVATEDALASLDFGSLASVGGTVTIDDDDALTTVRLGSLASVGGLQISHLDALTSLSGLDGLRTIDGDLAIERNSVLTSVSALYGVTRVGGSLSIRYNTALSTTQANTLAGEIDSIGGTVTISGNGP
jgi:hypothetical protein